MKRFLITVALLAHMEASVNEVGGMTDTGKILNTPSMIEWVNNTFWVHY